MKKNNFEFLERYRYKIKTVKEFNSISPDNGFIQCHGVFDVVHPGHIRHFLYAKSLCDTLLVTITSDKFIKKGVYRPHIPEKLRALNLAAMEMVDFVIIDENEEPLNLIKSIKPNFFAKGFEYGSDKVSKATSREINALKSHGGKMIFTPGDHVYSSSKIIKNNDLKITEEKFISLLKSNKITLSSLMKIIENFKKINCHVVGDMIVDTYTRTKLIGGYTKTPTPSVQEVSRTNFIGGAGIVAEHVQSAGANVSLTTVLGNDDLNKFVRKKLSKNIIINYLEEERPTTNKNVIICEDHRLLKIDNLDNRVISSETLNLIKKILKKTKQDIVILADFRHGIFNESTINQIVNSISKRVFKVADSQVASRWGSITDFKNFDLLTPNEKEARFSLADQDSTVGKLSEKLRKNTNCKNLILKLGSKGVFCSTAEDPKNSYFSLDSFTENTVDPVGAGDALLAYSALALKSSKSIVSSSIIGSFAAAIECQRDGNIPVKAEEVSALIENYFKKINIS